VVKALPLLIAAALLGPVGVVKSSRALADRFGEEVGRGIASGAAELARRLPAQAPAPPSSVLVDVVAAEPPSAVGAGKQRPPRRGGSSKRPVAKARRGIFISSATVLRLASGASMPNAVPVPGAGNRPAGLRLVGVGGLGVGMRDGDVLTRVFGGPVTSVGAVVQGVIAARARHAPEISAEFWRDGEPWSLTVQQPYLEANSPP
jgi:hypothetical protein